MTGMFAVSKAGHDKGKLYIIIKEENEYVYLADGRQKPLEAPKKKKKKHIQIIKRIGKDGCPAADAVDIEGNQQVRNEDIKRAIKEYARRAI